MFDRIKDWKTTGAGAAISTALLTQCGADTWLGLGLALMPAVLGALSRSK